VGNLASRDVEPYEFDVFVSHASEDKARFVEPLNAALRERGIRIWYDAYEIRLGDDFRRKMDEGLARSRFGIVVLSPSFFKYWPEAELSALFAQEAAFDQTRILPVRCDLDRATLIRRSPLLAARADISWEMGVAIVADRIRDRVRDVAAVAHSARSPVYNLPFRRSRQLFGRGDDLERLDALLVPGRSVQVAASIEGLAGVGKTELALHMVDRLAAAGRFPGGIFWFDAEHPDLTTTWGSTIADALAVGPGPIQERAAAALRIASSGAPVLIVLDNVESWTRASEPRPLLSGTHIALLVTTRHRFLGGPSFEHYTLDVLPAQAARELLISVAGRDIAGSPGLDDLLRQLDGHSLAIELAGAYLHEFPSVTPAEYLRRLKEGLPVEEKVQDLVRYEATLRRALDVHWAKLDEGARTALIIAACFDQEEASIKLLEACGVDEDWHQPLRRFHLIAGDGQRWRMHRLVREWARRLSSREARPLHRARFTQAKQMFVVGCADYSRQISASEGFRIYRADGKHLEQAVREGPVVLGPYDARVTFLQDRLATALQSVGDLPRAKELFELSLAATLQRHGEDHGSIPGRRLNLALVLVDLGDLARAKELLELALAAALRSLGEDHPEVASQRSTLAFVLKKLGDLPRAKELSELAMASDLKNFGEDHPSVAVRRTTLGLVYSSLGDLPRAKELLELALASDLRNFGEDHPTVADVRSNLGLVLNDLGDHLRAKELLELALASDLKDLGEDHPSVAIKRGNLAVVLRELGELPRAKELLELAVASDVKNLGENHREVAVRRFNLAHLLCDAGDLAGARTLLSQVLAFEDRALGENHPSTVLARASLANVLYLLGDTESARAAVERALRSVATQPAGSQLRGTSRGTRRAHPWRHVTAINIAAPPLLLMSDDRRCRCRVTLVAVARVPPTVSTDRDPRTSHI
jgi:tetratricopeptide (TPR) repeat protein